MLTGVRRYCATSRDQAWHRYIYSFCSTVQTQSRSCFSNDWNHHLRTMGSKDSSTNITPTSWAPPPSSKAAILAEIFTYLTTLRKVSATRMPPECGLQAFGEASLRPGTSSRTSIWTVDEQEWLSRDARGMQVEDGVKQREWLGFVQAMAKTALKEHAVQRSIKEDRDVLRKLEILAEACTKVCDCGKCRALERSVALSARR